MVNRDFLILIVDDEESLAENLKDILEAEGYTTVVAFTGEQALKIAGETPVDLSITDIRLPDITGEDLIHELAAISPGTEYIIITGHASLESAIEAASQQNIVSYETKPLNIRHLLSLIAQVKERREAREETNQAAEEWRTTFDSITDMVSILDRECRFLRVNRAFAQMLGIPREEIVGKNCYQLVHGCDEQIPECPYRQMMKTGEPCSVEFYEPKLGRTIETSVSPIYNGNNDIKAIVHIMRDVTQRRRMEEQLIVTDRLASIGELSSGIAHELNNPLTSVIGFSDMLLDKELPENLKQDIEIINTEAKRTAMIVNNLLTFARKHPREKKSVNLNAVIDSVLDVRSYEQKVNNITVELDYTRDLPEIIADGFQLQQVFLNIVINAEYFINEAGRNPKILKITTESDEKSVRAVFTDNGTGISGEHINHLFDPFFTTKEIGKGTGLGLSICFGIISEHNGTIYAKNNPGDGASFVVELPGG